MLARGSFLLVLIACASCAGVEGDIKRAAMKEFFLNLVKGKDRGAGDYSRTISKSTTKLQGRRYQYRPPAHISHYLIERSVRGLGGTKTENADYLAFVVDRLFFVLAHDPTAGVRSSACEQLGRVLLRLPLDPDRIIGGDIRGDQQINQFANDLKDYADAIKAGKKVTSGQVVERMDKLAAERPSTFASAQQMMRAFAAAPIVGSSNKNLKARAEELVPRVARDCILVALREVAFGDPVREEIETDPAPIVRAAAVKVLGRVGARDALPLAVHRTADSVDPPERDRDVLRQVVYYFGAVGGAQAFEACLYRLDDKDSGIRYHAQRALLQMTDANVAPTSAAWREWQSGRPAWQVPKKSDKNTGKKTDKKPGKPQ